TLEAFSMSLIQPYKGSCRLQSGPTGAPIMCLPTYQIRSVCQEQCLVMGMPCDQDPRLDVALAQTAAASNARMKTEFQTGVSTSPTEDADLKCLFVSCAQVQLRTRRAVFLNPDLSPDRRQDKEAPLAGLMEGPNLPAFSVQLWVTLGD
ncbi:hypothetical protein STEG23_004180, partial [Scotinomys teguina]